MRLLSLLFATFVAGQKTAMLRSPFVLSQNETLVIHLKYSGDGDVRIGLPGVGGFAVFVTIESRKMIFNHAVPSRKPDKLYWNKGDTLRVVFPQGEITEVRISNENEDWKISWNDEEFIYKESPFTSEIVTRLNIEGSTAGNLEISLIAKCPNN